VSEVTIDGKSTTDRSLEKLNSSVDRFANSSDVASGRMLKIMIIQSVVMVLQIIVAIAQLYVAFGRS